MESEGIQRAEEKRGEQAHYSQNGFGIDKENIGEEEKDTLFTSKIMLVLLFQIKVK
jgi:hypothetical protein